MRNTFLGLIAVSTLFIGAARAAEPSTAAQERAALFQRQVRDALVQRSWRITKDENGKLVAERRRIASGTYEFYQGGINKYAHLEISFRPESRTHTVQSALASTRIYNQASPTDVDQQAFPSFVLRDPKLTREYREVIAEAERQLAAGHKTYAAPKQMDSEEGGKVAMR